MHSLHAMQLLTLLPESVIPLMMVLAGLALVLQFGDVASALFTAAILMIVLPIILEPFLDMLPSWALTLLMVYFCFSLVGMGISLLIGKNAKDQLVGTLAADVVRFFFFVPFRVLLFPLRLLRVMLRGSRL